jgi:hypothetical protein
VAGANDDDRWTFIRFEGLGVGGKVDAVLSRAALRLHSYGILRSIRDGHPGFVSDDYLNATSEETTISAIELCTAGLWERSNDGYFVIDGELLSTFLEAMGQRQPDDDDDERHD